MTSGRKKTNHQKGGIKAAKTTKQRHGKDHHKRAGHLGGTVTARRFFGK